MAVQLLWFNLGLWLANLGNWPALPHMAPLPPTAPPPHSDAHIALYHYTNRSHTAPLSRHWPWATSLFALNNHALIELPIHTARSTYLTLMEAQISICEPWRRAECICKPVTKYLAMHKNYIIVSSLHSVNILNIMRVYNTLPKQWQLEQNSAHHLSNYDNRCAVKLCSLEEMQSSM